MTTIVKPLGKDVAEVLEGRVSVYLRGSECYAFAIALHRAFGWTIVGLMQGEVVFHAAVRDPEGTLHDARGPFSENEFGDPFVLSSDDVREVSEKDLFSIHPIRESSIKQGREIAELLWSELPWQDTFQSRVIAFADALEQLSAAHGLCIRNIPSQGGPVIVVADEKEGGYTVAPTYTGQSYYLDSYLSQGGQQS